MNAPLNPTAPSAAARLDESRAQLRRALLGDPGLPGDSRAPPRPSASPAWLVALQGMPVVGLLVQAAQAWWVRHPLPLAGSLAATTADAVLNPIAPNAAGRGAQAARPAPSAAAGAGGGRAGRPAGLEPPMALGGGAGAVRRPAAAAAVGGPAGAEVWRGPAAPALNTPASQGPSGALAQPLRRGATGRPAAGHDHPPAGRRCAGSRIARRRRCPVAR